MLISFFQGGNSGPIAHSVFSEVPGLKGKGGSPDFSSRVFPVVLFLHLNCIIPWTPGPACFSRVSQAPLEERKGQSDTGGNSQPCSLRGLTRPLPQLPGSPGLPCSSFFPSGSLSPGQGFKPDLGLEPSSPLVILLEVGRGQAGPAQPQREAESFLILGRPDRAWKTVFLQPHCRSSHARSSRAPPAFPSILLQPRSYCDSDLAATPCPI